MQIGIIPRSALTEAECRQLGEAIHSLLACGAISDLEVQDNDERQAVEHLRSGRLPHTIAERLAMNEFLNERHLVFTSYESILEIVKQDAFDVDSWYDELLGPNCRTVLLGIPETEIGEVDYPEVARHLRDHIPENLVEDVVLDQELSWVDF